MNNFVVVIFPDETRVDAAIRELDALHREGSLTVYATARLDREPNGELSVDRQHYRGPLGAGLGALAGGLVGILGAALGPAGAAAAGALAGGATDVLQVGLEDEMVQAIQRHLAPGTSALLGDIAEDSTAPLDERMTALGGKVARQRRKDLVAGLVREDMTDLRAELTDFRAEQAGRNVELMETKLDFDLQNAKEGLERVAANMHERIDRLAQELEAKLGVLGRQATRARPEVRDRIERRVSDLRRELRERRERLERAYELAREALH